MEIEIRQLCKSYGEHMVLSDFSAHIKEGLVTSLMAPLKHSKTTLFRILMELITAMKAVGLEGCAHQPVHKLSGGMRCRVSILCALMADYDILFLDEPFKGLDQKTKELVIEDMIKRIVGKTVLLVTHDPEEACVMGAAANLFSEYSD